MHYFTAKKPTGNPHFEKKWKSAFNEQRRRIWSHAETVYKAVSKKLVIQMREDQKLVRRKKFASDNKHKPKVSMDMESSTYFGIYNALIMTLIAAELGRRTAYHGNWNSDALRVNQKKMERVITIKLWKDIRLKKASFFSDDIDV